MEMSLEMVLEPDTSAVADGRRADRDLALLEALRRHESTAAERLLTTYGERAYRLAVGITGNEQDAEEVVQDALWSVVRKIDTFRGESAFGSWLYRIVANAAYQKLRGRQGQRRDVSLDEVLPLFDERGRHVGPTADWSARVDDPSIQTELRLALTTAIDELPAGSLTMLAVRHLDRLSNGEIAAVLGLHVPGLKTPMQHAPPFLRPEHVDVL